MTNRRSPVGREQPGSVLVVIPTFNERDNLHPIVQRLRTAVPTAHVLIVDDGSPDGTGALAERLAARDEHVHVLHRTEKSGLGMAYVAGFDWGRQRDYEVLVEMDADGSHAPEELPRMLRALGRDGREADVVLGSRYVPGGRVVNWPRRRAWLSRGANLYTRLALGAAVCDITSGFRAYRRAVLERVKLHNVASQGYCFQVDLAWRAIEAGFTVAEVPITFVERESGESKMSGSIVWEALVRVTKWGLRRRANQVRSLVDSRGRYSRGR
ncbi:polyprenol monophosphomannose synthase [Haloactinomyces albus]|uniref:Dolichol-phosphate mannosyltransferase n=1 Tax=Haloactinomyces albus TaxID=1352928 RepID=A0AAE3ZGT1_9ACTN|nr:polyprenol monophosphomannose synthase [Haloactinomyces albus]MDR7303485.1 dolichol-phosphate mannosyltransferase [Haloactinomyces albus]